MSLKFCKFSSRNCIPMRNCIKIHAPFLSFENFHELCVQFFIAHFDPTHLTWQVTNGLQGYCFILCCDLSNTTLKLICLAAFLHPTALCVILFWTPSFLVLRCDSLQQKQNQKSKNVSRKSMSNFHMANCTCTFQNSSKCAEHKI